MNLRLFKNKHLKLLAFALVVLFGRFSIILAESSWTWRSTESPRECCTFCVLGGDFSWHWRCLLRFSHCICGDGPGHQRVLRLGWRTVLKESEGKPIGCSWPLESKVLVVSRECFPWLDSKDRQLGKVLRCGRCGHLQIQSHPLSHEVQFFHMLWSSETSASCSLCDHGRTMSV